MAFTLALTGQSVSVTVLIGLSTDLVVSALLSGVSLCVSAIGVGE
jgi:hypothetical protein